MPARLAVLFSLLLLLAHGASAQPSPVGSEFQVNTFTTGAQDSPDVAMDPEGRLIVVWDSGTVTEPGPDGDGAGIRGRRYDSDGTPQGSEFAVNTVTSSNQRTPSVATDALGNFVVVWRGPDGDGTGIQGQRFLSDGTPAGSEFQVNSETAYSQSSPEVAIDSAGNFVVVWNSDVTFINGRRFASDGTPFGDEFPLEGFGLCPRLATLPAGFVVVWRAPFEGGFLRRFAVDGTPLGSSFKVSSSETYPAVASEEDGDFVVVWSDYGTGNIAGRRFASDGAFLGGEFQISTTTGSLGLQDVSLDAAGNFVAVWSRFHDGSSSIRGRRFAANGTSLGGEFQVNTATAGSPSTPAVASDADGDLVVVWDGTEIHGQRFTPDESADVAIAKDDGVDRVLPGAQVVYTIVAENLGPSFADPVSVTDVLPPELACDWTSAAAGGAAGNTNGSGDLDETLSLPAESSVTYTVTCDVDVGASGTLSNTATIFSPLPDPVPSNNSATDDDTRLRIADLSVTQDDTPDPAPVASVLTYTIQVANAGPEPAEDVRVTSVLPPDAALVDVSGTGWVCNGAGSIVICGRSVLGVGSAPPLTMTVTTPPFETVLSFLALVSAIELDPDPDDNLSSELTAVIHDPIFSDGFESGDVSLWSSAVTGQ